MKIVKQSISIRRPERLATALEDIEYAARISHRSEDDITDTSAANFIEKVIVRRGDWSVVEHVSATVEIYEDRGITHEQVRHRIASYTQESTRFVNYVKKMKPSFIYPIDEVECPHCLAGDEPDHDIDEKGGLQWFHIADEVEPCAYDPSWLTSIFVAEKAYQELIAKKWSPQDARSVFPNALGSKIRVTMNMRSWRQFLLMRTTKETHHQMRRVTIPLLAEFKKHVPILFDDIHDSPDGDLISQIVNARKAR